MATLLDAARGETMATLTVSGAATVNSLNVGSATGAAAGEVRTSNGLRLNALTSGRIEMRTLTLANLATGQFPNVSGSGSGTLGMAFVFDNGGDMAIYRLGGALTQTTEIADPTGVFTNASGTASSNNIYWSAGNSRYELENRRGSSRTYTIILFVDA